MTTAIIIAAILVLLFVTLGAAYHQPPQPPPPKTYEQAMLDLAVAFNQAAITIGTAMTPAMNRAAAAFNQLAHTWADEIAKHPTWQDMIDRKEAP